MEIERRFLVQNIDEKINLNEYEYKEIVQYYLYVDKLTAIRKRKITKNDFKKYMYTVKTGKKGISVNEYEEEIDEKTYLNLCTNSTYNTIIKKRYCIPYMDGLIIELDIFSGIYEKLAFAEIEYKSEEQAKSTKIPEWFGKEISSIVTNSEMAMTPSNVIFDKLKNL